MTSFWYGHETFSTFFRQHLKNCFKKLKCDYSGASTYNFKFFRDWAHNSICSYINAIFPIEINWNVIDPFQTPKCHPSIFLLFLNMEWMLVIFLTLLNQPRPALNKSSDASSAEVSGNYCSKSTYMAFAFSQTIASITVSPASCFSVSHTNSRFPSFHGQRSGAQKLFERPWLAL